MFLDYTPTFFIDAVGATKIDDARIDNTYTASVLLAYIIIGVMSGRGLRRVDGTSSLPLCHAVLKIFIAMLVTSSLCCWGRKATSRSSPKCSMSDFDLAPISQVNTACPLLHHYFELHMARSLTYFLYIDFRFSLSLVGRNTYFHLARSSCAVYCLVMSRRKYASLH